MEGDIDQSLAKKSAESPRNILIFKKNLQTVWDSRSRDGPPTFRKIL